MKGESAEQVAERMRALAASMSDKSDADEIKRYANWLVSRRPSDAYDELPALGSWPSVSEHAPDDQR